MAYKYRYKKVITDTNENQNAKYNIKTITVEEYTDLAHHTHNIEDLVILNDDGTESPVSLASFDTKIDTLMDKIIALEERANLLQTNLDNANSQINKMQEEATKLEKTSVHIGDFDVEKEGVQDINGFTVKEL